MFYIHIIMSTVDFWEDVRNMIDQIDEEFIDICVHTKYNSNIEYIKSIVDYLESNRDNRDYISLCLDYLSFTFHDWIRHSIVTYLINKKLNLSNKLYFKSLEQCEELLF